MSTLYLSVVLRCAHNDRIVVSRCRVRYCYRLRTYFERVGGVWLYLTRSGEMIRSRKTWKNEGTATSQIYKTIFLTESITTAVVVVTSSPRQIRSREVRGWSLYPAVFNIRIINDHDDDPTFVKSYFTVLCTLIWAQAFFRHIADQILP